MVVEWVLNMKVGLPSINSGRRLLYNRVNYWFLWWVMEMFPPFRRGMDLDFQIEHLVPWEPRLAKFTALNLRYSAFTDMQRQVAFYFIFQHHKKRGIVWWL